MVIRQEQMEALSVSCQASYENALVEHVTASWPEVTGAMGPDKVRAVVHDGIVRAKGYDIRGEQTVRRFVEVLFQLSPTFDTSYAWSAKILTDQTLTASEKMDRVSAALKYELSARGLA